MWVSISPWSRVMRSQRQHWYLQRFHFPPPVSKFEDAWCSAADPLARPNLHLWGAPTGVWWSPGLSCGSDLTAGPPDDLAAFRRVPLASRAPATGWFTTFCHPGRITLTLNYPCSKWNQFRYNSIKIVISSGTRNFKLRYPSPKTILNRKGPYYEDLWVILPDMANLPAAWCPSHRYRYPWSGTSLGGERCSPWQTWFGPGRA